MTTFIETLKLRLLLTASMLLLRRAQKRSERFREMLNEETFVMQIRTLDGAGSYFELREGKLRLHHGVHGRPDLTQLWGRSRDAVKVMLSKDETDILRAFEGGQCRMQGRFAVALWFNEAMKIVRS
ncbi:hypothetical protein D9M71_731690 [compost metagenome]